MMTIEDMERLAVVTPERRCTTKFGDDHSFAVEYGPGIGFSYWLDGEVVSVAKLKERMNLLRK